MSFSKRSISGFPIPGSGSSNINSTANNKVSLGLLRGKAITTSVPTIKFSAGAEEVVEVFNTCYEEEITMPQTGSPKHDRELSTTPVESDTSQQTPQSASTPANDPWRFFSGIKGKITKSVEGKLIEYKNKSAITAQSTANPSEDAIGRSPKINPHKHTTNNSSSAGNSRSDSEDISESSLSKTQGGLSTTEGAEMTSTDEENEEDEEGSQQIPFETIASMQKQDKSAPTLQPASSPSCSGSRYRLRTVRTESENSSSVGTATTEETVGESFLRALQRLASDSNEDNNYVDVRTEQGVDVLEDMDLDSSSGRAMQPLDMNIDNMTINSDDVIEVREVIGSEIRADLIKSLQENQSTLSNIVDCRTIFNPKHFVDLRHLKASTKTKSNNTPHINRKYNIKTAICATILCLVAYCVLSPLSVYFSGYILGVVSTLVILRIHGKWLELKGTSESNSDVQFQPIQMEIFKTEASTKNDSNSSSTVWMNEWPAIYTPQTYTVTATQPVHLRLQRHLLRVSNTNARLPKHDMKVHQINSDAAGSSSDTYTYTRHRIYDLRGAAVTLQPVGLTRIRWWSKKYPICIQLSSPAQLTTQETINNDFMTDSNTAAASTCGVDKLAVAHKQVVRKRRKWQQHNCSKDSSIQFSKLMFDDKRLDKDGGIASSMIDMLDLAVPVNKQTTEYSDPSEKDQKIEESADDGNITRLYLFARTCRDKETWFQLLSDATSTSTTESLANIAIYHNYMDTILNVKPSLNNSPTCEERPVPIAKDSGTAIEDLVWLNALLGRAWYSYATGGAGATMRLKDRIQRKLAAIRLPAFIEELKLSELSICPPKMFQKVPVCIKWASRPLLDGQGVWVDLDLEYESNVVLILQTKLNLMRLKDKESDQDGAHPCGIEYRSAIFHSDVDDSAESSSDDDSGGDSDKLLIDGPDSDGAASSAMGSGPVAGSPNHKLIRMVDRIADSRLFRAATEYRYVQRALENVRNTDLCLRVEVQSISGRLCVNLPPPPSDRVWFGFRASPEPPKVRLRALPTVGDYHISLQHVTGWLEKRLVREFHKVLVLPNMEDIILPGLR